MIYYRGRWLIEPEIKALLSKLEDLNKELRSEADRVLRENAELRAKVESANRQIAEYKRLLKAAVEDFNILGIELDSNCELCGFRIGCEECPLYRAGINCRCWNKQSEAVALIEEECDTNA